MSATIWKLLALIAVMLLPLGMQPAMAAPSAAHHAMAASMPVQHCPDQRSEHPTKGGFAECTMACSAALPAAEPPHEGRLLIASAPTAPAAAQMLHGLHPDTATPPPKPS